jgi:predicted nuclease of predicted toxin-antitoxin system
LRFLADENIFPKVITHLRNLGHDVKGIQESGLLQTPDDKIINIAAKEERTIITFDIINTLVTFSDIPHKICQA